jgi:hypothetical protein
VEELISYIANDERCLSELIDLESGMDALIWLEQNLELYMNVTYGPEGLPRVADCNYEGRKFDSIETFALLYINTHHEHKGRFNNP